MSRDMSPPKFTEVEDDVLVQVVAYTPTLFDPEQENYRNLDMKAALWEGVAKIVKRDVESCKRRWKDIKNNYFKIIRQQKRDRCNWILFDKLHFLDRIWDYGSPERRIPSPFFDEDRADYPGAPSMENRFGRPPSETNSYYAMDNRNCTPTGPSGRKRRFEEVSSEEELPTTARGRDDVDLFMRSIAMQVKRMSPRKIAQAKVRILTIVNELQFGQLRVGDH